MKILIDQQPCDCDTATIASAIEVGSEIASRAGRLVVEIKVDGRILESEELSKENLSVAANTIEFQTACPGDLLDEVFTDGGLALEKIQELLGAAASKMESDDSIPALESLQEAFELWNAVQQAVVNGLALAGIDPNTICTSEGVELTDATASLKETLQRVRDSMKNEDRFQLVDVLLYELPEICTTWSSLLQEIRQKAARNIEKTRTGT